MEKKNGLRKYLNYVPEKDLKLYNQILDSGKSFGSERIPSDTNKISNKISNKIAKSPLKSSKSRTGVSLENKLTNATTYSPKGKPPPVHNNNNNSIKHLRASSTRGINNNINMSSYNSSTGFVENIKQFESLISEIKLNGFDRIKQEIDNKQMLKTQIENNVMALDYTVKFMKCQSKLNGSNHSKLMKETEKLCIAGDRAQRDIFFINKDIPELKQELEQMNDAISLKHEELRYIRNDAIELDKNILSLKDDFKKMNKSYTDLKKEKENIKNGINLLTKHIATLKEKIQKRDENSQSVMENLTELVNQSYYSKSQMTNVSHMSSR